MFRQGRVRGEIDDPSARGHGNYTIALFVSRQGIWMGTVAKPPLRKHGVCRLNGVRHEFVADLAGEKFLLSRRCSTENCENRENSRQEIGIFAASVDSHVQTMSLGSILYDTIDNFVLAQSSIALSSETGLRARPRGTSLVKPFPELLRRGKGAKRAAQSGGKR